MGKIDEPNTGLIARGSTLLEKSTPEELEEYYRISRQQVIEARRQGGIEWDDGNLKSKERFCKEYKKDEKRREGAETQARLRKEYWQGNDRKYKLTKPTDKKNDNEDI